MFDTYFSCCLHTSTSRWKKKNPWKKNLRLRRRWHKWKLHLASLFGSTEAVLPPRFRRPDFVGFQGCRKLEFLLSSCRCFPWGWRFLGNSQENSPYKTHCIFVPLFFWVSRSFSFQKAAWQVILKRKKPKQILDSQLVSPPTKWKREPFSMKDRKALCKLDDMSMRHVHPLRFQCSCP